MNFDSIIIEIIGWTSTAAFLFSIIVPKRIRLHQLGVFTSITTGIYAYYHGATAIWVKWVIALFFHCYMMWKLRLEKDEASIVASIVNPEPEPAKPQRPIQD